MPWPARLGGGATAATAAAAYPVAGAVAAATAATVSTVSRQYQGPKLLHQSRRAGFSLLGTLHQSGFSIQGPRVYE
eukprot:6212284-Pleurochrysis_carterae.AAC.3